MPRTVLARETKIAGPFLVFYPEKSVLTQWYLKSTVAAGFLGGLNFFHVDGRQACDLLIIFRGDQIGLEDRNACSDRTRTRCEKATDGVGIHAARTEKGNV